MKTACARLLVLAGLVCLAASSAWGVRTNTWHLDQPGDYLSGRLEDLALTNRAELLLAPRIQRYPLDAKEADTVNSVAIGPDGVPYIGTGPNGIIYRIVDDTVYRVNDLAEGQVFSLLFLSDRSLLAGVGGSRGVIYRIEPNGQASVFWQAPDVRYVWAMVRDAEGNIYAGTGGNGEIYRITADGRTFSKLASLTNTRNVLSLAMTGDDRLIFGTDGSGLIGAINTKTGRLRILYDAGERNITAIAPQPDGTVYVTATRSSREKAPAGGTAPSRPQGRPDRNPGTQAAVDEEDEDSRPAVSEDGIRTIGTATSPSRDRQSTANAIYRIEPSGLTTEVMNLPAMLLAMVPTGDDLLISAGSPGRVYRLEPSEERYVSLLREDSSYFTAVAGAGQSYWAGTSRPAGVVLIKPEHSAEGTFTGAPLDAGQLSLWGQIRVSATVPPETDLLVQTRSSNTRDVTGPGWSDWSEPIAVRDGATPAAASPPGRFLQVRLVLKSSMGAQHTPLVRSIDIPYQTFNLAPEISSLSASLPNVSGKRPTSSDEWYVSQSTIEIEWQARDPNGDTLTYDLYSRPVGTTRWSRLARNLSKTNYSWDSQKVADGAYELRLIASDLPDNPPGTSLSRARLSEAIVVDKMAPQIDSLQARSSGERTFEVRARLADKASRIIAAQYSIGSSGEWIALLPMDGIFDSQSEDLDFEVGPLSPGEHVLTVRAADERGNTSYAWRALQVGDGSGGT